MPDCHTSASCVIGFTSNFGDKITPNTVGVDIGCGMYTAELGKVDIDFSRFDSIVNLVIHTGSRKLSKEVCHIHQKIA